MRLITLEVNAVFDNKFGRFTHDSFVGRKFGDKVWSRNGKGYVFVFRLEPEFFTKTLAH